MATPLAINSPRLASLINDNIRDEESVTLLPCEGLAHAIESENNEEIDLILNKLLTYYMNKDINAVVLGCTHYPIIKDKIQEYFKDAVIIDGNIGVAKRVKELLSKNNLLTDRNFEGNVLFIQTKKEE
jgi:glutamate racemase